MAELAVVLLRAGTSKGQIDLQQFVTALEMRIEPFTAEQAQIAAEAYRRFGKGFHPAQLNLGDCFSYALAMHYGEPLLFKGNDFGLTDVLVA